MYFLPSIKSVYVEKSLKVNVAWMFIGNCFYAFMQWIQLSVIAKSCTPTVLGYYTLALAITAPIFMFLGLQLRSLIVTDAKSEWDFSSYFVMRMAMMCVALIVVLGCIVFNNGDIQILFLVAVLKVIEGLAEIFNAQQQLFEKMHYVARSLILKGLTATASIFVGVYVFGSLPVGLILAIASNLLVLFFNDYLNCKKLFNGREIFMLNNLALRPLFVKALPLGIVMCIISLNTNISKYMLEYFVGTEQQGTYSTIAYCLVLGNFVNGAIGQSFSPRMSKYFAENNIAGFKKLFTKYILVNLGMGTLLFAGSLIGGYYFLRIMFSETIADYSNLFSLVMLSGIFLYLASAMGYTLTAMRMFKIQPFINGVVLVVNTISCFVFLQYFGIYGVVYASILSFIVMGSITFYFIKKNL